MTIILLLAHDERELRVGEIAQLTERFGHTPTFIKVEPKSAAEHDRLVRVHRPTLVLYPRVTYAGTKALGFRPFPETVAKVPHERFVYGTNFTPEQPDRKLVRPKLEDLRVAA